MGLHSATDKGPKYHCSTSYQTQNHYTTSYQ